MAAVDVPQHLGLGGRVAGEFAARAAPRRLASLAVRWAVPASALAILLVLRRPWHGGSSVLLGAALMFAAFAGVGLAVRRARVAITADGVRWGWGWLGVRLERDRIRAIDVYRDAVAFRHRRGSTWFVTAYDWERFDALVLAVEKCGLPVRRNDAGAPWLARLQSYGRFLDGLLVVAIVGATIVAVAAAL